jgi:hypothetical protein
MFWLWMNFILLVILLFAATLFFPDWFFRRIFNESAIPIPSAKPLRIAVARQIKKYYSNAETILDIGSGWGGMSRFLARQFPDKKVTGIELMLMPFTYSKITNWICCVGNVRFVRANAFKFLRKSENNFDIGVAYLLTPAMAELSDFHDKLGAVLALDFPFPNIKPTRKINLHYKDCLGEHWLYVYEK